MQSYQITEWGKPLEPRQLPTPDPQGTQVLVRVDACGVCHSDLHIWSGYFDLGNGQKITLADRGVGLPFTLGHEVVGEVAAVGPEVEGVSVGDKRIVFPWIGCGQCDMCAQGLDNLCNAPKSIGARVDGGYSDHVIIPRPKYLIDYTGIAKELACTYACSGITAYSALKKVPAHGAEDSVVIIGAGGVGLNAVHLAKSVLQAKVIVADIDASKRDAALSGGADAVIDNGDSDAVRVTMDMTNGGALATIDFVGMPPTSRYGIDVLRRGGSHIIVGLYGDALPISLAMFPLKAMTVRGSYVGTLAEMHELMALVKAGKVPALPIQTRDLSEANQALDDLKNGRVVGRIVLTP